MDAYIISGYLLDLKYDFVIKDCCAMGKRIGETHI